MPRKKLSLIAFRARLSTLFFGISGIGLFISWLISKPPFINETIPVLTFLAGIFVAALTCTRYQRWGVQNLDLYDSLNWGDSETGPLASFGFYLIAVIAALFFTLVLIGLSVQEFSST